MWMAPFLAFVRYAPKTRINILVVRLKPVPKGPPKECVCRSRGTAFQNEMLSVKEIRGVACIKRKRLEAGERPELGRAPFPTVTEHPHSAECTDTVHSAVNGCGIPTREIEIASA